MVEDFNNNDEGLGPTSAPTTGKRASVSSRHTGTGDLDLESTPSIEAERRPSPVKMPEVVPHDGVGSWLARHWMQSIAAVFTVACLFVAGAWYVSMFDSSLSSIQEDVKDVKGKVDKLANDNARQNFRLDYIERVLPIGKTDAAQPKLDATPPKDKNKN